MGVQLGLRLVTTSELNQLMGVQLGLRLLTTPEMGAIGPRGGLAGALPSSAGVAAGAAAGAAAAATGSAGPSCTRMGGIPLLAHNGLNGA